MNDGNPDSSFERWLLGSRINLLLVGVSPDIAAIAAQLPAAGYGVRCVQDSGAALTMLDEQPCDLVIVDWDMPGREAERLCAALRSSPDHAGLYAIAVVPASGPGPAQVLGGGADDYLVSPFDEAELLTRVRAGSRSAMLDISKERVQALIGNIPGAIYRCADDDDWTMELISGDIQRISGYPPRDFIQNAARTFNSIIHPDDRRQVRENITRAVQEQRIYAVEYRITRADGALAWVLDRGQKVHTNTGRSWLDGAILDITDRKLAEAHARQSVRLLAVSEDRQRIGMELHDGIIQSVFGVRLALEALSAHADSPDEVRSCLTVNVDRLNSVIDDVRCYINGMRPTLLADRELSEALTVLAEDFQDISGIGTAIELDPDVAAHLAPHAADVVQMAREALSNVHRHARAATCQVSLTRSGDDALLVIADDGRGFDAAGVHGHGLVNLAARAKKLGGQLTVTQHADESRVQIRIPLADTGPSVTESATAGPLDSAIQGA